MTNALIDVFPDPEVLLALEPEEIALVVFQLVKQAKGNMHFQSLPIDYRDRGNGLSYPPQRRDRIEAAAHEAWYWLKANGLIIPEAGTNGRNGFHVLSRRGAKLDTDADFSAFRQAAAFPKTMLHPSIADLVWLDLARGDLQTAVFKAFRAVEEAVRQAGKYSDTDYGVDLMRAAFHKDSGPLTNKGQAVAEREALAHLLAGAIGSYKNPHSHRTVTIKDTLEAQEQVMLASHLLRIVDSRRKSS